MNIVVVVSRIEKGMLCLSLDECIHSTHHPNVILDCHLLVLLIAVSINESVSSHISILIQLL